MVRHRARKEPNGRVDDSERGWLAATQDEVADGDLVRREVVRDTLVDIQTPDRLGLLYYLLRALGRANVQIALSRIATEKGAAIDTFYVTDMEGKKIKDAVSMAHLQMELREASQMAGPS